jgi:hypothetical protein
MIKAQVCRSRGYSFRFIGQDSVSEILVDKKTTGAKSMSIDIKVKEILADKKQQVKGYPSRWKNDG